MKFKTIALAALAAATIPAFAKVEIGSFENPLPVGAAEYVFVATNSKGSYFQDLGVSASTISTNWGHTFTQAVAGAEWNKFVAFGGTGTQWAIFAVQPQADGFAAGEINAWTTVAANQGLGIVQNSQSNDGTNNLAVWFQQADNASNPKGANNRLASAFGTPTYFDNGVTSFNSYFNARNAVGVEAKMVYLTPSSDVTDEASHFDVLTSKANFDGTTVSITTAVPEPSSYAMLVAGLAAVGFVARRRKA